MKRKTVFTLLVAFAMTVCAGCTSEAEIGAREGRDRVVKLVVDTAGLLGGEAWNARKGAAWAEGCSLGGEVKGAHYSFDLWAPRGERGIEDARRVAAYWKTLGMNVWVTDTPYPTVFGEGGPALRASFMTGAPDNAYNVGAVAPCAPGDAFELNNRDDAARDRGHALPGDEFLVPEAESDE